MNSRPFFRHEPRSGNRCVVAHIPLLEYRDFLRLQSSIVGAVRGGEAPHGLIVTSHPHTVTLGLRGTTADLRMSPEELARRNIALHTVDRGGAATYHHPGQVVCYPILNLRTLGLRVRDYVHSLEQAVLMTLGVFMVEARRKPGAPGIWTDDAVKIASIGVRVRDFVTTHGVSLNVTSGPDATQFITVCGMPEVYTTSIEALSEARPLVSAVSDILTAFTASVCRLNLERVSLPDFAKIFGCESPPGWGGPPCTPCASRVGQ